MWKKVLSALAAVSLFCGASVSAKEAEKELKILTIGNSFAWSVFSPLKGIVKQDPSCKVEIVAANLGGCSLERHWKNFEKSEKDPKFKPYDKKFNLRERLLQQKWDVVTIQQVSHESWNPKTYQPYADKLIKLVRELAPTAEIVVQQTWSYSMDDPRVAPVKPKWGFDQTGMYERLNANYRKLAKDYNFRIIPTGYAVQLFRKNTPTKIKLAEHSDSVEPRLPAPTGDIVGSFRMTKDRKTGKKKVGSDTIHLNGKGAYLQGCVWYAFLFGKDATKIKYAPKNVSPEEAAFLRKCAQEAVTGYPQVKK